MDKSKSVSVEISRRNARQLLKETISNDLMGLVVHHVDGNPLNNDPINLSLMTRKEHSALHGKKQRKGIVRSAIYSVNRRNPIQIRVSAEELDRIKAMAEAQGLSLASYIRWALLYKDKEVK